MTHRASGSGLWSFIALSVSDLGFSSEELCAGARELEALRPTLPLLSFLPKAAVLKQLLSGTELH